MSVLECVKSGVKPGQVVLAVDLTVGGSLDETLAVIEQLGYQPEIRHVSYATGIHVHAILKDEQHETVSDDYWLDEWEQLISLINPNAVYL